MPTLEALYRQDPESLPFRMPVDPQLLCIPVCISSSSLYYKKCTVPLLYQHVLFCTSTLLPWKAATTNHTNCDVLGLLWHCEESHGLIYHQAKARHRFVFIIYLKQVVLFVVTEHLPSSEPPFVLPHCRRCPKESICLNALFCAYRSVPGSMAVRGWHLADVQQCLAIQSQNITSLQVLLKAGWSLWAGDWPCDAEPWLLLWKEGKKNGCRICWISRWKHWVPSSQPLLEQTKNETRGWW